MTSTPVKISTVLVSLSALPVSSVSSRASSSLRSRRMAAARLSIAPRSAAGIFDYLLNALSAALTVRSINARPATATSQITFSLPECRVSNTPPVLSVTYSPSKKFCCRGRFVSRFISLATRVRPSVRKPPVAANVYCYNSILSTRLTVPVYPITRRADVLPGARIAVYRHCDGPRTVEPGPFTAVKVLSVFILYEVYRSTRRGQKSSGRLSRTAAAKLTENFTACSIAPQIGPVRMLYCDGGQR